MKKRLGFNIVQPEYTPQPRRTPWPIVIGAVLVNAAVAGAVAIAWFGGFLPL